jgi:hypothetical protein
MSRYLLVFLCFVIAGCADNNSEATAAAGKTKAAQEAPRGAIEGREFSAIESDAMHPAFTEVTVIKLNAIVRRSLDTANEFTGSVRAIRASVDAATTESASDEDAAEARGNLRQIGRWHEEARAAQADMTAAAEELRASDEIYNEEILTGMIKYVDDVERMLRQEQQNLSYKLGEAIDD